MPKQPCPPFQSDTTSKVRVNFGHWPQSIQNVGLTQALNRARGVDTAKH